MRNIRDALTSVEVGSACEAPTKTVFAMFRKVFDNSAPQEGRQGVDCATLSVAYASEKAARKSDMAQRRRNKFNSVDTAANTPSGRPHRIDECISPDNQPAAEY